MPFNKKFRLLITFLIILCLSLYPVAAAVPQQYDVIKDDKIDELDLGQVSQCIGSDVSGDCINADVNNDGTIDEVDYNLVNDNYQKGGIIDSGTPSGVGTTSEDEDVCSAGYKPKQESPSPITPKDTTSYSLIYNPS